MNPKQTQSSRYSVMTNGMRSLWRKGNQNKRKIGIMDRNSELRVDGMDAVLTEHIGSNVWWQFNESVYVISISSVK